MDLSGIAISDTGRWSNNLEFDTICLPPGFIPARLSVWLVEFCPVARKIVLQRVEFFLFTLVNAIVSISSLVGTVDKAIDSVTALSKVEES